MQAMVSEQKAQPVKYSTARELRSTQSLRDLQTMAELRDIIAELSSQPTASRTEYLIIRLAELSPEDVVKFCDLFPIGYQLDYSSTNGHASNYFILVTPHQSRILSTRSNRVPCPNCTDHIRWRINVVQLKTTLHYSDSSWLSCLSQLIQIELDRSVLSKSEHQNAFRLLRELASDDILPPSLFVDVKEEGRFAVNCRGGSADIYKGRLDGVVVCIKVSRYCFNDPRAYKQFVREGVVWRQLKHPNVLQCLGVSKSFLGFPLSLISPWMKNGNIMEFLERNPDHNRLFAIRQIASGIEYLHGHQPPVVHRDIKGANILVNDQGICCLADFGLVSLLETQRSTDRGHGTLLWQAPERLDPDKFPKDCNGCPADIYSFAWTIIEICCGGHPLHRLRNRISAIRAVMDGVRIPLPPDRYTPIDDGIWDIVKECWQQQPDRRLKIGRVVERLSLLSLSSRSVSLIRPYPPIPTNIPTPPRTPAILRVPTPGRLHVACPLSPGNIQSTHEPVHRPHTPIRTMLLKSHPTRELPSPPISPFQGNVSARTDTFNRENVLQSGLERKRRTIDGYESDRESQVPPVQRKKTGPRMLPALRIPVGQLSHEPSTSVGGAPPSCTTSLMPSIRRPPRPFHSPIVEDE